MIAIKMRKDITKLKTKASKYPTSFTKYIDIYFKQLWENLRDEEGLEEFSLEEQHGYIVIIEDENDLDKFKEVSFIPEFLEEKELEDGYKFYITGILYNNEYMMIFIIPEEAVARSDKILEWIKENI